MVEKQTKTIRINDKEYSEDDFSDEQKIMISHVVDLERKISSTKFNLDQLNVGRSKFLEMLEASMEQQSKH